MIQVQYLLSCLLRMCETLFHSLEAAFAYLKTSVRLSPNSHLQVKLCIFFQCFHVGWFFYSSHSFVLQSLSGSLRWDVMEVSRVDMVSQRSVIIVSDMRGLMPFLVEYCPIHRHTHPQCSLPISGDYDTVKPMTSCNLQILSCSPVNSLL